MAYGLREGAELEITLLGRSPAKEYDPSRVHGKLTEAQLLEMAKRRDPSALEIAINLVKTQTEQAEETGNKADDSDPAFEWAEITTNPKTTRYSSEFYEEFCRLAGFSDFESKGIRFYNSLYTLLDKMGVDFFLEIDPRVLPPEKFGELRTLDGPVCVTGDVTINPEKSFHKADGIFQYDQLPDTPREVASMAKRDAAKMMKSLVEVIGRKLGSLYSPPILKELDKMTESVKVEKAEHSPIVSIGRNVVKRVRAVSNDLTK